MPIEIRELHIKAVVEDTKKDSKNNSAKQTSGTQDQRLPEIDEIVKLCVEKVMEILQEREER